MRDIELEIQIGSRSDFQTIKAWDEFWGDRRQEMQGGQLFTARTVDGNCVGYLSIVPGGFLHYPLISLLCVDPSSRRMGVANRLIAHAERVWYGARIFTTTESDNAPVIGLFKKREFKQSGYVDDVNATEIRELIFSKDNGVKIKEEAR